MMALIADFDRRGGWKDGFGPCAEWLAWKIGITIGPARERVRAARALENLPQTADALRDGTISYAKVRALTRAATPESETELLEFARASGARRSWCSVRRSMYSSALSVVTDVPGGARNMAMKFRRSPTLAR